MRSVRTVIWLIGFLLLGSEPAWACRCARYGVGYAKRNADVVVRGQLVNVEFVDPPDVRFRRFLATLKVDGVWKGQVGQTVVLHAREPGSDCIGFSTEVGTEVVVFAQKEVVRRKSDGRNRPVWNDKVLSGETIVTPRSCSYNGEIRASTETLKKLGPAKPPVLNLK